MAMAASNVSNEFPITSIGGSSEPTKTIRVDREVTIFPARQSHRHNILLSPLDLSLIMFHYAQKGLFYEMPAHRISSAIDLLEKSLSRVLIDFYPLAGCLATSPSDGVISIDCNDAGVAFIEASAEDVDIADLMTAEVTPTVYQLFSLNGAFNVEGHRLPLLAVQVTKLRDGMFVACSVNHVVADGISLWHFLNSWAEICSGAESISVIPIHDRCLFSSPPEALVQLNLNPDADFKRFSPPALREKVFHFSKHMIQGLKDRANRELQISPAVSSLQALCGHVWQAISRARRLEPQDSTSFRLALDCRRRILPQLPSSSFGNFIQSVCVTTTAGELESSDVSYPAQLLQRGIGSHGDKCIRSRIEEWKKNGTLQSLDVFQNIKGFVMLGSSPRFKMYETDFGWGKPVGARSGCGIKGDGKINAYPGKEGDGSVDLEICLSPNTMDALEIDEEFLNPHLV